VILVSLLVQYVDYGVNPAIPNTYVERFEREGRSSKEFEHGRTKDYGIPSPKFSCKFGCGVRVVIQKFINVPSVAAVAFNDAKENVAYTPAECNSLWIPIIEEFQRQSVV